MCGIVGKYVVDNSEFVSRSLIERMCDEIRYRGPDDAGLFVENGVGLGHRRLSIIDLSKKGRQPMSTNDEKLWIVFNGEVYNFLEHKKDLQKKGYIFASNTDTEVILNLYKEYGENCVKYLRGMFALAIWDVDKSILFLARDRIGKKPLYYYFDGINFLFASELKCLLLDPVVNATINDEAVCDFFRYSYVPDPKTIYNNIYKLEPGHSLSCSAQGVAKRQYWDVSFKKQQVLSLDEVAANLLDSIEESVKLRLVSDVPLGAFLSGGIDSSAVVALMAQLSTRPVKTCSIGFALERFDESEYARQIADIFNTDHHSFSVRENVLEALANIVHVFDEPFSDPSAIPTYYVCKLAREMVTVALSGDGGDESFAGYEKYHLDAIENRLRRNVPSLLRTKLFPILAQFLSIGTSSIFKRGSSLLASLSSNPDYAYYQTNTFMSDTMWEQLVNGDFKKKMAGYSPFNITERHYHAADTDDHLSRIMYTDIKTYLPGGILVKVDRASMVNSLEVRSPFLDHELVEFAATIPSCMKYQNGDKKVVLKKALENVLPGNIMRRKKMGFTPPLDSWFRNDLKQISRQLLLEENQGVQQYCDIKQVEKIWDEHQIKRSNHGQILWSMLMFELWYKRHVLSETDRISEVLHQH